MLSRTADHLYWMSRYLERAECLARMLDAHHRLSMLPRPQEAVLQGWSATLVSLGMEQRVPREARGGHAARGVRLHRIRSRPLRQHRFVPARRARERAARCAARHLGHLGNAQHHVSRVALVQRDDAGVRTRRFPRMGEVSRAPHARRRRRNDGSRRSAVVLAHRHLPRARGQHDAPARSALARSGRPRRAPCRRKPRNGPCCCARCRRSRPIGA